MGTAFFKVLLELKGTAMSLFAYVQKEVKRDDNHIFKYLKGLQNCQLSAFEHFLSNMEIATLQ